MLMDMTGARASLVGAGDLQPGFVFDADGLLDGDASAIKVVHGAFKDEVGEGHEETFISKAFVIRLSAAAFPKSIESVAVNWRDDAEQPEDFKVVAACAVIGYADDAGFPRSQRIETLGEKVENSSLSQRSEFFYEVRCLDRLKKDLNFFGVDTSDSVLEKIYGVEAAAALEAVKQGGAR